MASTSVVLPWSTWAMMATLRMSARCILLVFSWGAGERAFTQLCDQGTGWSREPGFAAPPSEGGSTGWRLNASRASGRAAAPAGGPHGWVVGAALSGGGRRRRPKRPRGASLRLW